ncbi:MAG: YceI family protein, partial [Steroidobacteraceae bacterium]
MKPWMVAGMLAVLGSHAHAATTYVLDPAGGKLSFAFNQAGAENTGQFRKFDVKLTLDDRNPTDNRLDVQIQVASLDTQDEERDEILRSADLFDCAKHATASFVSKRVKRFAAGRYVATGTLTIRGVAREVQVPFTFADGRMSGST